MSLDVIEAFRVNEHALRYFGIVCFTDMPGYFPALETSMSEQNEPTPRTFFTCGPHDHCPHLEQCVTAERCVQMDAIRRANLNGHEHEPK
jgi:hypothetical protein